MHALLDLKKLKLGLSNPQEYQGPYTAQRAPGHMIIDLVIIPQQPECCPYCRQILYQLAFLSPALDHICEDKG